MVAQQRHHSNDAADSGNHRAECSEKSHERATQFPGHRAKNRLSHVESCAEELRHILYALYRSAAKFNCRLPNFGRCNVSGESLCSVDCAACKVLRPADCSFPEADSLLAESCNETAQWAVHCILRRAAKDSSEAACNSADSTLCGLSNPFSNSDGLLNKIRSVQTFHRVCHARSVLPQRTALEHPEQAAGTFRRSYLIRSFQNIFPQRFRLARFARQLLFVFQTEDRTDNRVLCILQKTTYAARCNRASVYLRHAAVCQTCAQLCGIPHIHGISCGGGSFSEDAVFCNAQRASAFSATENPCRTIHHLENLRSDGHCGERRGGSSDYLCNRRAVIVASVLALYVDELKELLHDLPERFQRTAQGRNSVLSKLCKLACYASNQWSVCLDFFCKPNKPVCALFYHREERFTERLPQIAPRILCKLDGVFRRIATGQILVFHASFPCVLSVCVGIAYPFEVLFQHRNVLCYFRCRLNSTFSKILAHQTDLLILWHSLDAGEEVLDGPDGIRLHSLCKFRRVKS